MRIAVLGLSCILFALSGSRAYAWNSIGHMVVAKLAYDQLDDKNKLTLIQLLKTHPHYKDFLIGNRPDDVEEGIEWVVLRCSNWPDWIRPRKRDGRDVSKYHRGEEHYINIPFVDPKDKEFFANKKLVNPDAATIVTALKQRCNDLKTKSAADHDRAIAICWIFHLIGDIHQPLHNVSYFSSDPAFAAGDLGGNKFAIKALGRRWNLHAFWDNVLGDDPNFADDSARRQGSTFQEALNIAARLRGRKLSEADEDKLKKNVSIESWSQEAYELARTVAYQKADGSGMLKAVAMQPGDGFPAPADAEEVGQQYVDNARAVAQRQVVLAGRRLAQRLKMLLQ